MNNYTNIFSAAGLGLGDCWATVNYALQKAEKHNITFKLATWYKNSGGKIRNAKSKLTEILPLFRDISAGQVILVDDEPTEKLSRDGGGYLKWFDVYNVPYFSTKITWKKNDSKNICCHFDGKSHSCKRCTTKEEKEIIKFLRDLGFNTIYLGKETSLEEAVNLLSKCEAFVGVDSGFCHIAHSVRTPIHLIRNGRTIEEIEETHGNKPFNLYVNTKEFMEKVKWQIR